MTSRWIRGLELAVAAASVGEVIVAIALVRPSELGAGLLFVATIAAGAAPFVIVAFATRPQSSSNVQVAAPDGAPITTVVRVGGEPLEMVLACVAVASRAGPTFVVTADRTDLDAALAAIGVPLVRDDSIESGLRRAARDIATDAVVVVQPGAVPLVPACTRAAARLTDRTGWVVGSVRSFDDDSYAPEARDVLGQHLRARAWTGGLDLWERDATIVPTKLLRAHEITPGRPWGAWLRSLRASGTTGAQDDAVLALRVAPAGAAVFWPATVSRQRAAAADLADATTWGSLRSRVLAAGLLLRELYVYPLAVWLTAPLVVGASGAFPFRWAPVPFLALVGGVAAARWLTLRLAQGVALHPLRDLLAAAYDAPGSAHALLAACSRRVEPSRVRVSQRTLVWATIALATAAVVALVDRPAGGTDLEITAGLAVLILALLWLFALRLIAARRWTRNVMRIPLRLDARVDGGAGRTVDVSPAGLAVAVDGVGPPTGSTVAVTIAFPDGPFEGSARVVNRRVVAGREILGLALLLDPAGRARWVRTAFESLRLGEPDAALPRGRSATAAEYEAIPRAGATVRLADRIAIALGAVFAAIVLAVLLLAAVGYRPLVVRSDSMAPTFTTGDLIIVDDVRAKDVRVGDIVDFVSRDGESVTHRVRDITRAAGRIEFETRGDANESGERWSRRADAVVGRYRWRVPEVGRSVVWLREPEARWALLGLAVLLGLAAIARAAFVTRPRVSRPR